MYDFLATELRRLGEEVCNDVTHDIEYDNEIEPSDLLACLNMLIDDIFESPEENGLSQKIALHEGIFLLATLPAVKDLSFQAVLD